MKNLIAISVLVIAILGGMVLFSTSGVRAQLDAGDIACDGIEAAGGNCATGESEVSNAVRNGVTILLTVVGIASVIMLVIGGLRYVISGGDQAAITAAKNTIIYAVIGIIIAVFSYAIASFVFDRTANDTVPTGSAPTCDPNSPTPTTC